MARNLSIFALTVFGFVIALRSQLHSVEAKAIKAPIDFKKSILDVQTHLAYLNFPGCYIRDGFKKSFKFKGA